MTNERRARTDQRRTRTKPLSLYSLRGRRERTRRAGEEHGYYVDRYEPRYLLLIGLILVLCVLDALFTLRILELGGEELNPFMSAVLYKKPILALVIKYLGTALSVIFILVHKNFVAFGRLKVSDLMYVVLFVYLIIVAYEVIALFKHLEGLHF